MNGVPVLNLAGVRVRAHWSVLLVAALLVWGLAEGVIPITVPGTPAPLRWGVAVVAALVLIASLLAHELAHSLVARRRGVAVEGITLWVFGGVSHLRDDWQTPGTELRVAIAGPLVTLLLCGVFVGLAFLLTALGAPPLAIVLAQWLFTVNLLLLVFNLVPAFPLDGGRILRAAIWRLRGDRHAATVIAARAGRWFALVLMLVGVLDFLLTADVGGIWLAVVGWFLDGAARREQQGEAVRRTLAGARVREAMTRDPVAVPGWLTVQLMLDQYTGRSAQGWFPTHGIDGRIDGLVSSLQLRRVPPPQRAARRTADVALPLTQVPRATPDDMVTDVLQRIGARRDWCVLVFEGDDVIGMMSPRDVARLLANKTANRRAHPLPPPVPPPPPLAGEAAARST
ncbi:MAG: site-2 protease family protein [Candidatus Dormibacteraeota bacterium]|nr:site-2 protease family protein [Candidatus Dormibacteraeota bacterium]MBV9525065.1 site-2 protease family protein [Candidatus Dormibacteraeota bacterium]